MRKIRRKGPREQTYQRRYAQNPVHDKTNEKQLHKLLGKAHLAEQI